MDNELDTKWDFLVCFERRRVLFALSRSVHYNGFVRLLLVLMISDI